MKRKVFSKRREAALIEAQAMIERACSSESDTAPDVIELVAALPLVFESALGYLLSEFDYESNQRSNTAIALRLLATAAARLQQLRTVPLN